MATAIKTSAGKETASQTVARAKSMLAQTKAEGSKSYKGSSYEKEYQASAIAADGLAPTAPINLPEKPTVPDVGNLVAPGNIGLQSSAEGMYTVDPATGMTTMAAPTDNLAQNQQGRLADMFAAYEGMGSGEADLAKLEKENKLAQKRQAVSNYTGQLNAIVAKSQAEQLGLEGQGRGITESIIGGQQAQINREAAIQALPIQAQLAAAQGDLAMAQAHVDKLFAIKRQDAQALFQFKSSVINSVYDFADKQEQRRLDQVAQKENREYDMQKTNMSLQNDWAKTAIEYGQSTLAGKIMALDPKSPTYATDLARLQGQVQKPMPTGGASSDWSLFNQADGTTVMYNQKTGEVKPMGSSTQPGGASDPTNLESKYTSLLNDIGVATSLLDQVGAGWLERNIKNAWSGNNEPAQLQTITDTIKANLLTMNTDPAIKKFFGPQMSNRDTELMTGAATTLNPVTQSPTEYQKDLQDAASLIARARQAVRVGTEQTNMSSVPNMSSMRNIILAPDGNEIQIIPE